MVSPAVNQQLVNISGYLETPEASLEHLRGVGLVHERRFGIHFVLLEFLGEDYTGSRSSGYSSRCRKNFARVASSPMASTDCPPKARS